MIGRPRREKRRTFGLTWWGSEWVEAIEHLSQLDQSRLPRGRTYARWGYVGELEVSPGAVAAQVAGSRPKPYHSYVKVKMFSDEQWASLFDVVASKVAHSAALIDGELSSELVDDAAAIGVNLLPVEGDITTGCSCPDEANPCKHAAAVCYLIADLLDDDPFELLHMRGRTQPEITKALRERRKQSAPAKTTQETLPEVSAKEFFEREFVSALPSLPRVADKPGVALQLPADFPLGTDIDANDLADLGAAVVRRAWEICSGVGDSGLKDSEYSDLIRRLAPYVDTPEFEERCSRTKAIKSRIEEDARLYAVGGKLALGEGEVDWYPDAELLEPAIALLRDEGDVQVRNNRVTCQQSGRQLRLGESEQWYEYRKHGTRWKFFGLIEL